MNIEDVLRALAPQVLGVLARRYGHFDECEDAVQEALLAAAMQWPGGGMGGGVPENPRAWLITVASRRLADLVRSDRSRRGRETIAAATEPPPPPEPPAEDDDTLTVLFMCAHPSLSAPSQIALTLRAVGGLSTAEIANAFLVPEATMAQRISRAKQRLKETRIPFELPVQAERGERLRAVLHVLYLIFNEGYAASSGRRLVRSELTGEAIRLARELWRLLPDEGEVAGLLALMLLTDARRPARTTDGGQLVPLEDQDRTRWNRACISEGVELISDSLARAPVGPYQLQAAIAAVHDEARTAADTDWPQILALYELLERFSPGPVVTLNHAIALAMVEGPQAGLELLQTLDEDPRMTARHRLHAVRAHLLELAGDPAAARAAYELAIRLTTSLPERRYLEERLARVASSAAISLSTSSTVL